MARGDSRFGDRRFIVEWPTPDGLLRAVEPTAAELAAAAGFLAASYNDPHNCAMMAHTAEMSEADVVEHFEDLRSVGGRPFLLERDGVAVGDADLRHVDGGHAEFAIMIGERVQQGRGLGTRFAMMLHAWAFGALALDRLFVTILPANDASRRLFEKLGHQGDNSPAARAHVDEEDDITMSLDCAAFARRHGPVLSDIRWRRR